MSTASHRRSGSRAGRGKPLSWHVDRLLAEEKRALTLLGLSQSSRDRSVGILLWAARKNGMTKARRRALAQRAMAARDLAQIYGLLEASRYLEAIGGTAPLLPPTTTAVMRLAELDLIETEWALRRPATDRRTGMERPRKPRLKGQRPSRDALAERLQWLLTR